jgi:hypothetical protein
MVFASQVVNACLPRFFGARRFGGRAYVLRVMVDEAKRPPVVVTAYRTSKIGKYWAKP